ncbi:prolipoprotein diacylglyceryl transferase [Victivallis vadensis]|uniref:Prolipoprotein diacylglyceryl transferase n=1 Tax=Victivallis vadensis TaxID=172901 RepID=A0A848B4Z5_9BACT|nr:prolipoprotein diacylglyceryl transferase family protein [Victivallis vadensis]NMD89267.1 prolipoprotein diacylglyceryl transferase [Victivallis vadensis]
MHQYIHIFSLRIGAFPLFIGLGLLFIALLVFDTLRSFKIKNEFETKIMVCIPLSLLFGCVTGYFSDVIFRGGIQAVFRPYGFGVTFYGWLLGTIIFYLAYSKLLNISSCFLLNCFLPTFSIAQAFGRIGCFLGGCCYGIPCNWGVQYPAGSLPYIKYGSTYLFPIQLLESCYLLIIFYILFKKTRFQDRALWYLIMMPSGRFFFEFLRGDNRGTIGYSILSPAQNISIIIFFIALIILTEKQITQGNSSSWKKLRMK